MKRTTTTLWSLLLLFFLNIGTTEATHIPGANITYTCNPANPLEYTFQLTLFHTCPGSHPATMPSSNFQISNTCGEINPTIPTFNQVGVEQDVNQLCATATSNCSGGTNPGVWMYTYEATIVLPADCDSWTMVYNLCCRDACDNLVGGTSNDMTVATTLNTLTAPCNNSPQVTSIPIPYACANTNFTYCLSTSDAEGDSVAYEMVAPIDGFAQTPIAHLAGFSVAQPLNGFTLDPVTGCISFNSPSAGQFVVAIKIKSYDAAGNITSEIIHDFKVIVMTCTNTPPSPPVGGITGFSGTATQTGSNDISACWGDVMCFDVVFEDAANPGDNIVIREDGTTLFPGATFVQTGTNPVTGTFCWTAQPGNTGNVVTFVAEDDGCPVMGTGAFAVNLNVITGVYAGADQTICGAQTAQLLAQGGSSYTWAPATGLSCTNCPNPVASPIVTTTYTVTGNLSGNCNNVASVVVNVVPDFPITLNPASATICANEALQLSATGPGAMGPYNYTWTPSATLNSTTISNPIAQPLSSTTYDVTMLAATGCQKTAQVPVTVSGIGPTVSINPTDTNICEGEPVALTSTAVIYPVSCGPTGVACTGTTGNGTVGTGTSSSSLYGPFYGSSVTSNYTAKTQYIFTAAELNALGFVGGTIETLGLEVVSSNGGRFDTDIYLGCTSLDVFPDGTYIPTASLTHVHSENRYTASAGFHNFNFNITDYDWDGVSNLVVQLCGAEFQTNGSSTVRYTSTSPNYRCIYDYSSSVVSCNEASATRSYSRANIGFGFCQHNLTSPVYQWVPSAGLSNASIANPVATPSSTTSYVLNVTSNGCTGSAITNINVGADYNLLVSATNPNICYGSSTTLLASPSVPGTYTYNWEPAATLDDPTAASPIATPLSTTTYNVTVTNGSCEKYGSVTVNVSGGPAFASASTDNICPGEPVTLDVNFIPQSCGLNPAGCSGATNTVVLGTGTTSSTTYGPFYGSYQDVRYQFLYTAADLTAMGLSAGTITEIGFNVSTKNSTAPFNGFTIKMGCTGSTVLSTTAWEPTAGVVYGPTNYSSTAGWNIFTLATPFDWDGTSSVVIETCFSNPTSNSSDSYYYSTTTGATTMRNYVSSGTTPGCSLTPNYTYSSRPNTHFKMCNATPPATATYTWAPNGDLNDASIKSPTATPSVTTTYAVSVVDPSNPACPSVGNVTVNVQDVQVDIAPASPLVRCSGDPAAALNAQLMVNGAPASPSGGSGTCGLNSSSPCTGPTATSQVGTGTLSTGTGTPYEGFWHDGRVLYLYTEAELTAAGLTSGLISSVGFDVATKGSSHSYNNFTIKVGCTNATAVPTSYPTGLSTVFTGTVNTVLGVNTHTFTTPYEWDGVSNLYVEICFDNTTYTSDDDVRYTTTGFNSVLYDYADNDAGCSLSAGATSSNRPNTYFENCPIAGASGGYTWSPATGLSDPAIQNPTTNVASNTTYTVSAAYAGCTVTNTLDVLINTPSTAPTVAPMPGTHCPNTTLVLSAAGGTAGTGATIEWYSGANGSGTWLGTGASYSITPTTSGQTYYARRESPCGNTADDNVTINLKDYIYGLNGATTNNYCTDNDGWHHFFNGDEILLSIQGDLTGAPGGFPLIQINDAGAFHQQTQGPGTAPNCLSSGLSPGEERFEMERSWNVDFGGGTLGPSYNVRFYYQPAEKTAIETAAANWMSTYGACGYTYKYANPNGFYWFKNVGSNYTAPDYDGTHYAGPGGMTSNSVNYVELTGVTSFSGGSGAVILIPDPLLAVEWLSFTGNTDGKTNFLLWSTESEKGTTHFDVQRSKDGINFESIGSVKAKGQSSAITNYNFDDLNPYVGQNYYRLRSVDTKGNFEYSNTIMLMIGDDDKGYHFYPNPTGGVVYYQYEATETDELEIEVIDVLGRTLSTQQLVSTTGRNNIKIDLKGQVPGAYVVRVYNKQNATMHTAKIIKDK